MSITYATAQRYIDITSCALGATLGINTVKEIKYKIKTKMIKGSGDADKTLSFQAKGMAEVDGSATIDDVVQAEALLGQAAADLVFTGLNPATGKVLTVTVKNCQFFDMDGTAKHDDLHGTSVTFSGFLVGGSGGTAIVTTASA